MLFAVVMMLVSLTFSGLVMAYVAYPHRGEDVPHLPWLGQLMRRGVDQLPLLSDDEAPLLRKR